MAGEGAVAAFEMLIRRLESVEDGIARVEKLARDWRAAEDVREIMLTPVTSLVGSRLLPHERVYRLCERLEDTLYDAVDPSMPGEEVVEKAVGRLSELGANRLTFLMLCQISSMTEELGAVIDLACTSPLVPVEEAVAFMLHAEDLALHRKNDGTLERIDAFLERNKSHWSTVGFVPGQPWIIGSY